MFGRHYSNGLSLDNYSSEIHCQFPPLCDAGCPTAHAAFPLPPLWSEFHYTSCGNCSSHIDIGSTLTHDMDFESEVGPHESKVLMSANADILGVNMARDNQGFSGSPLTSEMSIMESMNRTSPYTPEEKRERIERYRSKRNLRNFNKKIKYECRKTLADSRPRVRGRFARNDEIEKAAQRQWDYACVKQDHDEDVIIGSV